MQSFKMEIMQLLQTLWSITHFFVQVHEIGSVFDKCEAEEYEIEGC